MTFFFTCLFVAIVFWRPQEWLLPWLFGFPLLDLIIVLSLGSMMIEMDQGRVRFPRKAPQIYLSAGLWFAVMMSHISHTYFEGLMWSIGDSFKFCFFTFLLFIVLDSPSRLRKASWLVVALTGMMAVHALMQARTGFGFGGLRPEWSYRAAVDGFVLRTQFYGIFHDANDLAQMLACAIPLTFALTRRRTLFSILLAVGCTYLLTTAMLTTWSRGGLLALYTALGSIVVLRLPARWLPAVVASASVAAVAIVPLLPAWMEGSALNRVIIWGHANQAFIRSPIFGVGYKMFIEAVGGNLSSHNAFLHCYTEIGLFGYWMWLTMMLLAVLGPWRARIALAGHPDPEAQWLRRYAGAILGTVASFAVSSYFLSRAWTFPLFIFFAMGGTVPFVAQRYLPADAPPLIDVRRDVYFFGGLASVGSIIYIYISIRVIHAFAG